MQRLFSTFAGGWPGVGLLLLRAVVGIVLIDHGVTKLSAEPAIYLTVLCLAAVCIGLLLIAGLWTPAAGTLLVGLAIWKTCLHPENLLLYLLMGTIGVALAMVGPGAWSIDARVFGRKKIYSPKE